MDNFVYCISSKERIHLLCKVLLVIGYIRPKLLDDVEATTILFLLSDNERLKVSRVVTNVERFTLIVMSKIASGQCEVVLEV